MADDEPAALRPDPSRSEARHVVPQRPSAGRADRADRRRRGAARQLLLADVDRGHRRGAYGRRRPDGRLAGGLAVRLGHAGRGATRRDVTPAAASHQRPLVAQGEPGPGRAVRLPRGENIRHRGHPVQRCGRLLDAPVSRGDAQEVLDGRSGLLGGQYRRGGRLHVEPGLLHRDTGGGHIPGAVRCRHDRDSLPDVPLLGDDAQPDKAHHAADRGPAAGPREYREGQGVAGNGISRNGRRSRPRGF